MTGQSCDPQVFEFFIQKWESFKRSTNIQPNEANDLFRDCLPEDVQFIVHSTYGKDVALQSEKDLIENVKALVVMSKSRVAAVVEMKAIKQQPEERAESFLAKLMSAGRRIGFKKKKKCTKAGCNEEIEVDFTDDIIRDDFIAGLADDEIRGELMKKDINTLDEALKLVTAHEMAKRSQASLSTPESASKISQYKRDKRATKNGEKVQDKKEEGCHGCGSSEHGANFTDRKEKCPAWGKVSCPCNAPNHFKRVCRKKGVPAAEVTTEEQNAVNEWICQIRHQKKRKDFYTIDALSYRDGIWVKDSTKKKPLPVKMVVDIPSFLSLASRSQRTSGTTSFKTHDEECTPDTGATVTCGGGHLLKSLGLTKSDLIKSTTTLTAANGSSIPLLGVIPVKVSMMKDGKQIGESQRELLHISEKLGTTLLSRTLLMNFGSIPKTFPYPPESQEASAVKVEGLASCGCPTRTSAPPPPKLPCEPTVENVPLLEKLLLDHYSSSTFNTCVHQHLPLMDGPDLEIKTDPNAVPTRVRTPATIPIHWMAEVKKGIDKDVELGVLEWVPMNTPETWCSRMVVAPKHNGKPRRTIDLQGLNDASMRQTHHTEPPFRQASTVPRGSFMTVTDAYEGFHSVAIAATDRHKTTFITPWGRLRYRTAPQGYLASGDAYTHRFDKITEGVKNVKRNTDDSLLYQPTIEENFNATAQYLTILGCHGILQNKDKFQFCKQTVTWSGFVITPESVTPSPEMTAAIRTFPTPANVTDLKSFYALCNQVAVYYAVAPKLEPVRELLKKGRKWYWDEVLDNLFKEMRIVIADKVEEGVCLYDPLLKTALLTDWCKIGLGFVLTQKHCTCQVISPSCCTGGWKVTLVGSRFTSKAESSYSPTEGELLAVQDGLHRTRYFTLGCDDLLVGTDHKPLLGILNNKPMDTIDNPRILRIKEKTLAWRFKVIYVPGSKNGGPDCLSRRGLGTESSQINEVEAEEDTDMSTKDIRLNIYLGLLNNTGPCQVNSVDDDEHVIAAVAWDMKPMDWEEIAEESGKDPDIKTTIGILNGDSTKPNEILSEEVQKLLSLSNDLEMDGKILLFRGRPIIPPKLRKRALKTLHAAHQGVTKMSARAESSIFWPGITKDIRETRLGCSSCDRWAPSQQNLPPVEPVTPEYPFQHLSADHLDFAGYTYGIIVDRFSNWIKVYRGTGGAAMFVKVLRDMCNNFNVPETLTTDGGPHYVADETKKFLDQYGIKHRLTSVANPHANSRAEIAVKSAKRMLRENVGMNGSIDNVSMSRALMVHRNTPDPDTGLSPAELLIGRKLKGFLPHKRFLSSSSDLSENWRKIAEWRELALAKRARRDLEKWSKGTKVLPGLNIGTRVALQNQSGNQPKRWDRRGVVVENLPFHQYKVKLDGSNRVTLRNRKFIRPYAALLQQEKQSTYVPTRPAFINPIPAVPTIPLTREPEGRTPFANLPIHPPSTDNPMQGSSPQEQHSYQQQDSQENSGTDSQELNYKPRMVTEKSKLAPWNKLGKLELDKPEEFPRTSLRSGKMREKSPTED